MSKALSFLMWVAIAVAGAAGFGILICAPATDAKPNNVMTTRLLSVFMDPPWQGQ